MSQTSRRVGMELKEVKTRSLDWKRRVRGRSKCTDGCRCPACNPKQNNITQEKDEAVMEGQSLKRGRKKKNQNKQENEELFDGRHSGLEAMKLKQKVLTRLASIRYLQGMIDAYSISWGSSTKLQPKDELEKSEQKIAEQKREIKELMRMMDPDSGELGKAEVRIDDDEYDENEFIDTTNVVCSVCGDGDAVDGNDILLCDFANCNRAYHQMCHQPKIHEMPHEDADWFCTACACYCDCIDAMNEQFSVKWQKWFQLFPEIERSLQEEDFGDYVSEEDDDFEPYTDDESDRTVHTESAESGGDGEEDEEDHDQEKDLIPKSKGSWCRPSVLSTLMSLASPPASPRGSHKKKGAKGKGRPPGKGAKGTSGASPQGVSSPCGGAKCGGKTWYDALMGDEEESDPEDYDPDADSDKGDWDDRQPSSPKPSRSPQPVQRGGGALSPRPFQGGGRVKVPALPHQESSKRGGGSNRFEGVGSGKGNSRGSGASPKGTGTGKSTAPAKASKASTTPTKAGPAPGRSQRKSAQAAMEWFASLPEDGI